MVVALALGIGMNAAVFMFINALLLRPPQGVKETNKLVEVWLHNPKGRRRRGLFPLQLSRLRVLSRPHEITAGADGFRRRWNGGDLESRRHGADSARASLCQEICFRCWE